MAHFAWLDDNNIVYQVSVVANSDCLDENGNESEAVGIAYLTSVHGEGIKWKQTSFNTSWSEQGGSVHTNGGVPFRGQFAHIGDHYDETYDVFHYPFISAADAVNAG